MHEVMDKVNYRARGLNSLLSPASNMAYENNGLTAKKKVVIDFYRSSVVSDIIVTPFIFIKIGGLAFHWLSPQVL